MSRKIVDASGVTWELWEVHPSLVEQRDTDTGPPEMAGERRRVRAARIKVSPEMRGGWLAIRSENERRRIAPIPEGWEQLTDEQLVSMVESAESAGPPRRLIE